MSSKKATDTLSAVGEGAIILTEAGQNNQGRYFNSIRNPEKRSENGQILEGEDANAEPTLEQIVENIQTIKAKKEIIRSRIVELERQLKPRKRFNEERLLNPSRPALSMEEKILARMELTRLKNEKQYIDTSLDMMMIKLKELSKKRQSQLKKTRLQMRSASFIYLRQNEKNIQKRICRLLNAIQNKEDGLAQLEYLKSAASAKEGFSSQLLSILKEEDEETYILTSGRTKYHTNISENIRRLILAWSGKKDEDFLKILERTSSLRISAEMFTDQG